MKDKFIKYLESIGMASIVRERVKTIYEFYKKICPDEITGIFVTDYIKEDGSREYESLWFFSPKYMMEAKSFIQEDYFDMDPIANRIFYWEIRKSNYNFKKATKKSRLYLRFVLEGKREAPLKAAKENCDYLKDIMLKYVIPNLHK